MKKISLLLVLLFPIIACAADGAAAYQQGIDHTNNANGGKNASNIQNLIQLFILNKNLGATTGADSNADMNNSSQGAADVDVLKTYLQQTNSVTATADQSLNQPGGRGDQKKEFCIDYVNPAITPSPDKTKYAECQAVNELNKQGIRDYKASSGFSKNDAIFGANSMVGLAKKSITDAPQSDVLTLAGVGGPPGASGQQCVTVNKITPPQLTTAQCARAAIPDSTPCSVNLTPKVILEKYCDASGGAKAPSLMRKDYVHPYGDPVTNGVVYSYSSNRYRVDYRCGPKDMNGDVTTIYANISVLFSSTLGYWGGCKCGASVWPKAYDLLITPGVTTDKVSVTTTCAGRWRGFLRGCSVYMDYATFWYDGPEDVVKISDTAASMNGYGFLNSCPAGYNFVDAKFSYPTRVCTSTGLRRNKRTTLRRNKRTTCTSGTESLIPPHCSLPATTDYVKITPVITTKTGTIAWDSNHNDYLKCPASHPYPMQYTGFSSPKTCYSATYTCPSTGGPWIQKTKPTVGWTNLVPNFGDSYCTKTSAISKIRNYISAPHYDGGAGVRTRLVEEKDDTCASLQEQSATGPIAPGGSYAPTTQMVDTCPTGYTLVTGHGTVAAYCRLQPPSVAAIATTTLTCPQGGVVNTSTSMCDLQDPVYNALSTRKYSCPTGDVVSLNTCPNGGVLGDSGNSCSYPPYSAIIATSTCDAGLAQVGDFCYTDLSLSGLTIPNGSTIFDSNKTYSCNAGDVLNGMFCERQSQTVTCEHQPPSVPSYGINHYSCPVGNRVGNFLISYAIADNTVQSNSCVAFPVKKPATVSGMTCSPPYLYSATSNKCEYRMADYNSTITKDCSGNPGYTYDAVNNVCFKSQPSYAAF